MIVGTIFDSSTSEPISGVRVQTIPPTHRACSGVDGTYRIEGTDSELAEVYRVFFFKPGYEPMHFPIPVRTGPTADAHLRADTARPDTCEPTPPQPPPQGRSSPARCSTTGHSDPLPECGSRRRRRAMAP